MSKKNRHNEFGCLMAMVDLSLATKITESNKKIVSESIIYEDPNEDTFGYDDEPHVTIKYGFTEDLTISEIKEMLSDIKPFTITLENISVFNNEKYDVVKYGVEKNKELSLLRERADKFKSQNSFPDYCPHMTIAYVKPGKFNTTKNDLKLELPITHMKYTGINDQKFNIKL